MFKLIKRLTMSEKGSSLVELVLAIGILGIVVTTFFMAIFIATKSIMIADEKANAESLARAQMEYVKQQVYIYDETPPIDEVDYEPLDLTGTQYLEGTPYSIWSVNSLDNVVEGVVGIPWDSQNDILDNEDIGLQKIILKIFHGDDNEVLTLEGYKIDEGVY